jgi:tight adherence protein B
MVAVAPFAIILGAMAATGLLFYSFWDRLTRPLAGMTKMFEADLERAAMKMHSEQIVFGIIGFGVSAWLCIVALMRPDFLIAGLLLPALLAVAVYVFKKVVEGKAAKRAKQFNEQLEMVLRMISSGLRVGLGLRQALVLVTEDIADPARVEFARVVGETNVGKTLDDALESLKTRLPSDECNMMVDAIKVQSQTGGNLAKILEHLAATIKGRRQLRRKVSAMTGEARAGAWVIGLLPVFVGGFVMLTQPDMRQSMIGSTVGHIGLLLFAVLEGSGVFCLLRMLKFDI